MQQKLGQIEEELKMTKEQLNLVHKERDQVFDELREMKMVAQEANMKLSDDFFSGKVAEELSNLKKELNKKNINSLELELEKAKQLSEREVVFDKLKEELSKLKVSEARTMGLLSESRKRIQELQDEVERGKISETKMFESVVFQTKNLEQIKIELEESKLEVVSLREKIEKFDSRNLNLDSRIEAFERMRTELQLAKEGEEAASLKAESLFEDVSLLKGELNLAFEAEEKSKKAMDDLALALKQVATEANLAKEKLISTELELDHVKQEADQLKSIVRNTEDRYMKLLDEAKKETETHKNRIERLRLEAEESFLAWNDKEIGFVDCIKGTEEEMYLAQQENMRLVETLKAAETMTKASREENLKLRDILKQAINEATVAKEASEIARIENSQLKDSNAEKKKSLEFLARENERLGIIETTANETIKELKRLLFVKDSKTDGKNQVERLKSRKSILKELESGKNQNKIMSFDLGEHEELNEKVVHENPVKAETVKGSIFDPVKVDKMLSSKDLDFLEEHDAENDKNAQRKKKALLIRFGDLLRLKS